LPSDKSFASYDAALAHVTGPRLPEEMELYWNQQLLDVLLQYTIVSDRSTFSIEPRLARLGLRVVTALQFLPPAGASRAFEFHGNPGLVRLDPRWHQAALRFVELGFLHILDGTDHLLFILCLVIPFRKLRPLIVLVTSFTVAHSITLAEHAHRYPARNEFAARASPHHAVELPRVLEERVGFLRRLQKRCVASD
jgi:hypothetical protein